MKFLFSGNLLSGARGQMTNRHIITNYDEIHEGNKTGGMKENDNLGSNLDRMEMAFNPSPRE